MMTTDSIQREASQRPATFDKYDQYVLPTSKRLYDHQYKDMYQTRAKELKSRVMKMAQFKWKNETINGEKCKYVNKILDIKNGIPSFVIGTVFVDMEYKPNILKEVSENIYEGPEFPDESKYSAVERTRIHSYSNPATDQILLEDESGRILLDGEILEHIVLVTGVVVGVLGMQVEDGIFTIVDVAYPEAALQVPHSLDVPDQNILLISGLRLNNRTIGTGRVTLELLKEFVMGELTGDVDKAVEMLTKTTDIVILGNSMEVTDDPNRELKGKDKWAEVNKSNYDLETLQLLDSWINSLLISIPVTIMPGSMDPAELELPKQPLHSSLFQKSERQSNFSRLTNPAWLQFNGCRILATGGENVNDVFKYLIPNIHVDIGDGVDTPIRKEILHESRLKLLESNMLWQNVAPTAPDTLCCYPYNDTDPFCLTETPHAYIVGNQPKFETSTVTVRRKDGTTSEVRVVAVPDFSETGQCALLNMRTLQCDSFRILG